VLKGGCVMGKDK